MIKKLFWISLGFFVLTLVFLGVYNFAFKHNTLNPIADPEKYAAAQAEKEKEKEIPSHSFAFEMIITEPILFPKAEDAGIFYYSIREKSLKRISLEGKEPSTLVKNIPGEVKRLLWSPLLTGALAQIEENNASLWYYLDVRTQSFTPLKKEMSRLSWNTLGDGIFYIYTDPVTGNHSLNTSSYTGTNWKKLADLGPGEYFLSTIPQSSQVAFWNRPDGFTESRLESMSLTGEARKTLLSGYFGADYLWSPNGLSMLVSSVDGKGSNNLRLGITNEKGGDYHDLLIPTLINKLTWSRDGQTIYYALPNTFSSGTILPNDYFGKPIFTKDTFWKMNLKTGKRERLVPLNEIEQAFDATDLSLSPDETRLFFLDRSTSKLFRISL